MYYTIEPLAIQFTYHEIVHASGITFVDVEILIRKQLMSITREVGLEPDPDIDSTKVEIRTSSNLLDNGMFESLKWGMKLSSCRCDVLSLTDSTSFHEWLDQLWQDKCVRRLRRHGITIQLLVDGLLRIEELNVSLPVMIRTYTHNATLAFNDRLHLYVFMLNHCLKDNSALSQMKKKGNTAVGVDVFVSGLGAMPCRTTLMDSTTKRIILWLLNQPAETINSFITFALQGNSKLSPPIEH